jgi:DNA polymerase-3 subunit gamma/tau
MNHFRIDEIQGQDVALEYIRNYLKSPTMIPPLLVFHGPEGTGKWSLAERFSYQILCLKGNGCGHCESCKLFFLNQHPDYVVFPSDSRIAIGEDKDPSEFTIRWLLSKRIPYRPHTSSYRIVLFPDASLINTEAETAMLKTLEEPPSHTRFIFLVDDLLKIKQTVVSRGVCIPFFYLSKKNIQRIAQEKELFAPEYFGGSLNPTFAPPQVIELISKKVEESIGSPMAILQLEFWVKSYKDSHPEWEEDFNYHEFLELVCLLIIYHYSQKFPSRIQNIEYLYEFKEKLHYNIAGLDHFLLSQLFHRLTM